MAMPDAVINCELPGHSVALIGVTVIVGMFLTVIFLIGLGKSTY